MAASPGISNAAKPSSRDSASKAASLHCWRVVRPPCPGSASSGTHPDQLVHVRENFPNREVASRDSSRRCSSSHSRCSRAGSCSAKKEAAFFANNDREGPKRRLLWVVAVGCPERDGLEFGSQDAQRRAAQTTGPVPGGRRDRRLLCLRDANILHERTILHQF